ncbi:MAG: IclR family transcriptional regulator [Bacillota bacterium]|nr:IclR family transcriptional regulator [Bacillota bacterium]
MEDKNQINSVAKALSILAAISKSDKEMGLTEISTQVGLHKSTTFRLLYTLENQGFIIKDSDTKYKLGLKILELAGDLLEQLDLRKIARPILEELVKDCNETAHLVVLDSNHIVYIDKEESTNAIRLHSRIGIPGFAHSTSAGKAILAFLPKAKVLQLVKETGFPKRTDNTIDNEADFLAHLETIKKRGYAIDDIENQEGVRCIAAPVQNHLGQVIAAISMAGPSNRITLERIEEELKFKVMEAAQAVSRVLGYKK